MLTVRPCTFTETGLQFSEAKVTSKGLYPDSDCLGSNSGRKNSNEKRRRKEEGIHSSARGVKRFRLRWKHGQTQKEERGVWH